MTGLLLMTALAWATEPVVEKVESGHIDWSSMVLQVTARGDRTVGAWKGQAIQEADALGRLEPMLLEAARAIRVYPGTRAEILLEADPLNNANIIRQLDDGLRKQIVWRVSETRYLSGGGVEMDAELDLYAWLRPALMARAKGQPQPPSPEGQTGLLIDARHLAFRPCVAPEVHLSDGTVFFGATALSTQTAGAQTPVVYVSDPADPKASARAGSQPEFLTAESSTGQCTLVLSEQDSKILPERAGVTGWLSTGRVVIVAGADS